MKVLLWGTGKIANEVLDNCLTLGKYEIVGVIDNNKNKKMFREYPVYNPESIKKLKFDKIVILTDYFEEIKKQIDENFPELSSIIENKNFFYKESLLQRYSDVENIELKKVVDYIKQNGLDIFNYDFVQKYKQLSIEVFFDETEQLYFVYHFGKKLYFSRKLNSVEKVRKYYSFLLIEQDKESPHRYLSQTFNVNDGDVVVDVGVAEGNFSLEVIDKASKIYLIETDKDWIDALKVTFRPYMHKVIIINKYITSYNEDLYATLDQLIREPVNFIKMDIEGNEWDALKGSQDLLNLSRKKLKMCICTYHSDFDSVLIEDFLKKMHLTYSYTNGYMWFPFKIRQTYVSTSLNPAVIRVDNI